MLNDIALLFHKICLIASVVLGVIIAIYACLELDRASGDSLPDEIKKCLRK
jgi:hypothetical protein